MPSTAKLFHKCPAGGEEFLEGSPLRHSPDIKPSHYSLAAAKGKRSNSFYSLLISALDGGEWSGSCPGCALHPAKGPPVPIVQEAGWTPEPVWTQRLEENSLASAGNRTPVVRAVVRHCTD
jgi:hypothetical protein